MNMRSFCSFPITVLGSELPHYIKFNVVVNKVYPHVVF